MEIKNAKEKKMEVMIMRKNLCRRDMEKDFKKPPSDGGWISVGMGRGENGSPPPLS